MKRNRRRQRRGLTLLELMIVLIILVGLIALIGPNLFRSQKKASIRTTKTQIAALESALKGYASEMGSFPTTEEGLSALIQAPENEKKARKWDGPYLDDEVIPTDSWDTKFTYEYPPMHGKRDFPNIASAGPDEELNTEDDITNWRTDAEDTEADKGDTFNEPVKPSK